MATAMNHPNNLNVGLNGYMMPSPVNVHPALPGPGGVAIPTVMRMPGPGPGEQIMSQSQYQMALAQQAQQAQQLQQQAAANYYAQQRQQQHQAMTRAQAQHHQVYAQHAQLPGMNHVQSQPTYMNVDMNGQVVPVMSTEDIAATQHAHDQAAAANLQSGPHGVQYVRLNQPQLEQPGQPTTQMVMVVDSNGQQRMVQMAMRPGMTTHDWSGGPMAPPPPLPLPQTAQRTPQAMARMTRPPAVSLNSSTPQSQRMTVVYQPSKYVTRQKEQPSLTPQTPQIGCEGSASENTPNVARSQLPAHQPSPMESTGVVTPSPAQVQQHTPSSLQEAGPMTSAPNVATPVMMTTKSAGPGQQPKAQGSMGPPSTPPTGQRFAGPHRRMPSQASPYERMSAGMGMGMGVGVGTGRFGMRKRMLSTASTSIVSDGDAYMDSQDENQSPGNAIENNMAWDAPSTIAPGKGVLCLLQFCCAMREMEQAQNLQFCKHTVASWFGDEGKITYVLIDRYQGDPKTFELPYATLPRWFHANSLIRDRGTSFAFINAREEYLPIHSSVLDSELNEANTRALVVMSDDATWTSTFANGTHVTSSGSVKVVMVPDPGLGDLRIESIVFSLALHDEWILRTALQKGESVDQTAEGSVLDLDDASAKAAGLYNSSPALSTNNIKGEATPTTDTMSLPSVNSSKGSMKFPKTKPLTKKQLREDAKREKAESEARDAEKESAAVESRLEEETGQVDLMSLSMRRDGTADKVSSQGMASRQFSLDCAWSLPESRVDEYGMTHEAMRFLELVQGTMQLRELFAICASEKLGPRDALRRAAAQARQQLSGSPVDRSGNDSAIGYHQNTRATPMQAEGSTLWPPPSSHIQKSDPTQAEFGGAMTTTPETYHSVYPITPGTSQPPESSSAPGIAIPVSPYVPPPSPVRIAAAHAVSNTLKRKFAASAASSEGHDNESPLEGQMTVTIRQTVRGSPHMGETGIL